MRFKDILMMMSIYFILVVALLGTMIALAAVGASYDADRYNEQGYVARFTFQFNAPMCEIKVRDPDGTLEWRSCSNPGDDFVIENYGVRK